MNSRSQTFAGLGDQLVSDANKRLFLCTTALDSALVRDKLTIRARAVFQDGVYVFNLAAGAKFGLNVVDKFEQFGPLIRDGFGFLGSKIDQTSLDSITGGAPFVFHEQFAAVQPPRLVVRTQLE